MIAAPQAAPSRLLRAGLAGALAITLAACSSPPEAPNLDAVTSSQSYTASGTRVLPNNTGAFREVTFTVLSVDSTQAVVRITASGDIVGAPVVDTATGHGGSYTLAWNGDNQYSYTVSFSGSSCNGTDVDRAGAPTAWATCEINRTE